MKLSEKLARALDAFHTCRDKSLDAQRPEADQKRSYEWMNRHREDIKDLMKKHGPSGSGFDKGTHLDFDESKFNRLVFTTAFHHMNDGGFYDGWTDHKVIVTGDLMGINVKVMGRDRNQIKDYIGDCFYHFLNIEV